MSLSKPLVMFSSRFLKDDNEAKARALASALKKQGINLHIVEADAGGAFGAQTVEGLANMAVMISFATSNYGEKTSSPYCSYYEVKSCVDHQIPVIPIKMCQEWPPRPTGDGGSGYAYNRMLFAPDKIYLDWSNRPWDAHACATEVAEKLHKLAQKDPSISKDIFLAGASTSVTTAAGSGALEGAMGGLQLGGGGGGGSNPQRQQVPPGWSMQVDRSSGRSFYHHAATGTSQWDPPSAGQMGGMPMGRAQQGGASKAEALRQVVAKFNITESDLDKGDQNGNTLLHKAANNGRVDDMRLLLQAGATVDPRTNAFWTPLMCAAFRGEVDAAKLLVEAGADRNAKSKRGDTALAWARKGASAGNFDESTLPELERALTPP